MRDTKKIIIEVERQLYECDVPVPVKRNAYSKERDSILLLVPFRIDLKEISISSEGAVLGRRGSVGKEIFVSNKCISRYHCEIRLESGKWQIRDLHSLNGTWINDRRLEPIDKKGILWYEISPGDTLTLADLCFWVHKVDGVR